MPYLSENKFSPAEAWLLTALPRLSSLQTMQFRQMYRPFARLCGSHKKALKPGGRRAFVFLEKDSVVLKERVAVDAGVLQQFF